MPQKLMKEGKKAKKKERERERERKKKKKKEHFSKQKDFFEALIALD